MHPSISDLTSTSSETHLAKTFFRAVDRVSVLIASLLRKCVHLALVPLDWDRPVFDVDFIERIFRDWSRRDIIVRQALIAWNVVEVVSTHWGLWTIGGKKQQQSLSMDIVGLVIDGAIDSELRAQPRTNVRSDHGCHV